MDDGRWVTFAGGVLLGTAVATGSAYLALKYAPSLVPSVGLSESSRQNFQSSAHTKDASNNGSKSYHLKRRTAPQRTSSPASRLMTSRRSNGHLTGLQQDSNHGAGAQPALSRTLTSDMYYYQTPARGRDHHEAATGGNSRPQHQSAAEQAHGSNDVMTQNGSQHTAARRHTSANGHRANPFPFDGQVLQDEYTGGETDVGSHNVNFPDIPSETDGGNTNAGRGDPVVYAGPADRANFAVQEALRHTAYNPSSFGQHSHHNSMTSPSATNQPATVKGHLHHVVQSPPMSNTPLFQPGASGRAQYHHESPSPATSASGRSPAHLLAAGGHQNSMAHPANPVGAHSLPHVSTADALATEGRIIEDAALHEQYAKVITPETPQNEETEEVCWLLHQALEARKRWAFRSRFSPEQLARDGEAVTVKEALGCDPFEYTALTPTDWNFQMVDGVVQVYDLREAGSHDPSTARSLFPPPGTAGEFFSVMHWLLKISAGGSVRSYTHHRLQLLEQKFNLHVMLNADKEFLAQKSAPHRDFYNVRKVDTHVHHSACMHQKHLLRFIKSKLKKEGDEVVIFRDGKYLTLKEVFESLNLTPYDLSVDTLDVHADKNIFHRFDKFNLKYNPFGQSRLREIFIKQDNLIHGRYLAEVTREVFADLEASKYQHTEYRISVYGRKPVEWDTLAAWVVQNRLYSDNNVWMIQVPRLFNVYKAQGILDSFQQLLDNIFLPLFEVTLNPESHPMLHVFLRHVSGFDLVDDESKPERKPTKQMPTPAEWTSKHNPAYAYYMYYIYANLHVLNQLREHRGLNTFALRPHCGEAGDLDHLAAGFLLTENIAHGINLRKSPALQFLFYLAQIGLCMSPLSNNSLFLDYHRNPFPQFFARGLPVSLSTDDPLQIHLTREPLVEEYSVAAQVWKLSGTDLCEVARNSVLHSGFPHRVKMHWVHDTFWLPGPDGNNIQKTNVPALRMCFRRDCHVDEMRLILHGAAAHASRVRHEGSGAES